MQPALSQVCSLSSSFEDDLDGYARGQCQAVELWLTKLETFLQSHTLDDARRLLDEHGLVPAAASFQGGLLTSQGEARRQAWDLFQRRLELCESLSIETMVLACDVAAPLSQQDIERTRASLTQAARDAGRRRLKIALEFQRSAALGNNLQTAAALVEETGSPHLGLCLDVFHYYTGPSKAEDLAYLTTSNLFHVQVCDLADRPRELAADGDRILPGDGDVPLAPIIDRLKSIGYQGYVSLELMNPQIWQIPASQFGEIAMTAMRQLLGRDDANENKPR